MWRKGNRDGAIAGLLVGAVIALALTVPYMDQGGAVPWLEGLGSGLVGLVANLVVFVAVSLLRASDREELERVDQLFESAREPSRSPGQTTPIPSAGQIAPAPLP